MAVPILFELNQELTRLFAAGSRLAAGDPRLKKIVAPLKKYGEKAPVFLKLAEQVEELLAVDGGQSAQKLIETEKFLLSVLSTQGDTSPVNKDMLTEICYAGSDKVIAQTNIGYRTLSPVIEALTTTGGGRMEIVREAFEKGAFKDLRLCKVAVDALGDKYDELAEYMANVVLPSMGEVICPFLLDGYDSQGGNIDGRRLSVMHKVKGEAMLDLVDEAIENGSAAVRAEAVKIMSDYPNYEKVLLGMLNESKSVREEVMKALVKIDSRTGIDKMLEIYKGNKANTVIDAISYGTSEYLTDKLLNIACADYENVKHNIDALDDASQTADAAVIKSIQRLRNDINALKNKCTADTVEFFKTMLSEKYLMKAEAVVQKDKKQSYHRSFEDNVLEALYDSGRCNDFLWNMFEDTKEGFLDKILKGKKQTKKVISPVLFCYAFRIGAGKLTTEEFYDAFFKTHLYKEIARYYDYHMFEDTFLTKENPPAFSKKIVRYFAENMDGRHINLAIQMISPEDSDTRNLLAERLRNNLRNNVRSYINYEILRHLGETRHKDFKELYELYFKYYNIALDREDLGQFLNQ